jgi:hypothetical protein
MFWLKASLLTVIIRGATGAPWPPCPQPARVSAAASAETTAAHRVRPEATLASLLPTVDIRTCQEAYGGLMC